MSRKELGSITFGVFSNVLRPASRGTILVFSASRPKIRLRTFSSSTKADSGSGGRTYADALRMLDQLQPNKSVVDRFGPSGQPQGTSSQYLNAAAIPEMQAWLRRAGITPADLATDLRVIHVAGTKGKGSVAALASAILTHHPAVAGPVGTYTSPHVVSVRERIALDGMPISQPLFARYFFELWDTLSAAAANGMPAEAAAGPASKPFYFRFLTLLALHAFRREGVRSAVVECGIGGEHDATNVLPAEAVTATVVTQLGLDHTDMLGDTLEQIAWQKAGIFKRGVAAFTRLLPSAQASVMEVLRERAREKGVSRLEEIIDEEVRQWPPIEGTRLKGPFQKRNMALAVAAAREHVLRLGGTFDGPFSRDDYKFADILAEFKTGLRSAGLRGRGETFEDDAGTLWYLDGAHTVDSIEGVGRWFAQYEAGKPGQVRVLLFNQQERDVEALLKTLVTAPHLGKFDYAIFTRNEMEPPIYSEKERDMDVQTRAREIMMNISPGTKGFTEVAVRPTIKTIRSIAAEAHRSGKSCSVLVTGSFHLVGAVIRVIDNIED